MLVSRGRRHSLSKRVAVLKTHELGEKVKEKGQVGYTSKREWHFKKELLSSDKPYNKGKVNVT